MSYPHVNRNYHQLNSDASRNQNLKKSYDNLNDKIRNLQAELQQNRQPQPFDTDQYLNQRIDQDLSPIGSQVHTYITTVNSMENDAFIKSQQRPGPKIGQKIDELKGGASQEYGNRSYQQSADSSPKRYTASFKNKKLGAEEVKTRLKKIFQFYTTFGDRCNTSNLKSNKFHKMMSDANIREQYVSVKDLDLLFVAENKHKPNMDFNTFLQLLIKVAEYRYENSIPSREALERFIKEHMLPLYDNIYMHTDLGIEESGLKETIKENVLLVLRAVHGPLLKIYQIYFPWEIRTSQEPNVVKQRTEMALFGLLKEFDVCPSIMTKGSAFMVWTKVMETPIRELSRNPRIENMVPFLEKDIGIQFTFSRFCTLLIRIASIAYEEHLRTVNKEFSQSEKFALLLERMDLSIGMMGFEKKTHVTHNSKMSLLVPKNVIEQAAAREWDRHVNPMYSSQLANANGSKSTMNANSPAQNWQGFSDSFNRSSSAEKVNRAIGASSQAAKTFHNMLTISGQKQLKTEEGYTGRFEQYFFEDPELPLLFDTHSESLMRIFQYYCSYGEPMNNSKLKSIKFVRLLKESGLITSVSRFEPSKSIHNSQVDIGMNQFSQTDADIIFCSLTGTKPRDHNDKELKYNPNIRSPTLGLNNHLSKQNLEKAGNQGKLSYEGFLKAIEMVAHKILPEHNIVQAVNYVLDKHILELENVIAQAQHEQRYMGGSSLKLLVELLKDPEMVGFLSLVHKSMMVYYNFYADSRGLMNFEKFVQFCKHFSIFPDILAKARIKSFFQTLAAIHSQSEAGEKQSPSLGMTKKSTSQSKLMIDKRASETTDEEVIDQHLFVEGLALCAFEVPYNDPQPPNIAKVCYFLERINQSEGSGIVQKQMGLTRSPTGASWDILYFIKQKYPEMFGYKKDLSPLQKTKGKNFEDLMATTNWEV